MNDVLWILVLGNAANVRCTVLDGENVDVPGIAAFPAVCNGYRYTLKAIFSVDETVMLCRVPECTCSQVPRGRPSLLYDHTNVILRVVVKEGFYCTTFVFSCQTVFTLSDNVLQYSHNQTISYHVHNNQIMDLTCFILTSY